MKIEKVLFGGSFNPPTIAHYSIAKRVIEYFDVDEFIFLPTGNIYNKPNLIDSMYRIDMLKILAMDLFIETGAVVKVSDFEANQKEYLGTFKALEHYKGFYFLMGADNFIDIINWKNYPNVIIDNKFILINRGDINIEEEFKKDEYLYKYKDNFIIYNDFEKINASSSKYRTSKDKALLLDKISEYIYRNNLYND